jgi:two-component system CheB/CheR fusion protein
LDQAGQPQGQPDADVPPAGHPDFPVVALGASAGGLEALESFFSAVPRDSGLAYVVVSHMLRERVSMLPELLARNTTLDVVEGKDGMPLRPNRVHVGPPGSAVAVMDERLRLMELPAHGAPIDSFFRSLAQDHGAKAIGIVLSGTGTDGTLGLKEIKGASGMAMAQEPSTARYPTMPQSAIDQGLADYVLAPEDMPEQLAAYASTLLEPEPRTPNAESDTIQRIFVLLRSHTGHDFSQYKSSTIGRRIERRMNVHQIANTDDYLRYLHHNPHELDLLFRELLIGVTSFFRDPEAFKALKSSLRDYVHISRSSRRFASGWPAARRAKKRIPSPSPSRSSWPSSAVASTCRCSPPTWIRTPSRPPGRAPTPPASQTTWAPSGSSGSFRPRTGRTGSAARSGKW